MFGITYDDKNGLKQKQKQKHAHEVVKNMGKDGKKNEKILESSETQETKRNTNKIEQRETKNDKFRIFQVKVNVDITKEYNDHDFSLQMQIPEYFPLR